MYEIQKVPSPETIENYEIILKEAAKKNWSYTSEKFGYIWFERKITTTKTTKKLDETMFYPENLELWKKWSPKLREVYKNFRAERFAQHKDFVSYGAEKLLANKINKYSESISIKLMKASSGYKSIVEREDIITEGRTESQRQANMLDEEKKAREQQEALQKRQKQRDAIKESGKPQEYWEGRALKELRIQYPKYSEQMLRGQLNPRIRTILASEGLL